MASLERLARERGGFSGVNPAGWFDGFWDFFTVYRSDLETAFGVAGPVPSPWLSFYWERGEDPHLDLMMEARDYRPGAVAPWPVSRIHLDDGSPVSGSSLPARAVDEGEVRGLRHLGFNLEVGYWGIRASLADVWLLEPEQMIRAFDAVVRIRSNLA